MPSEEVRQSLLDLRRINRLFGGRRILLGAVTREVRHHALNRFSILDIASGSCDLPLAVLEGAQWRGLSATAFALEYWHRHLAMFRSEFKCYPNLHPICADAFCAPFADQSFDFVTCSLFFHHLTEERAVELLSNMCRWARYAVIVSDLERQKLPYYFFKLFSRLFTTSSLSRIDGVTSFRQSFRKEELERTAEKAGLASCTVERRWPFRLLLTARVAFPGIAEMGYTRSPRLSLCEKGGKEVLR